MEDPIICLVSFAQIMQKTLDIPAARG